MTTKDKDREKMVTCPPLKEQAFNANSRAEIRVDKEIGKLSLAAVKHLAKMMGNIEKYKENTQLSIISRILTSNKDYMKAVRELEAQKNATPADEVEDDLEIMIDLTSAETSDKILN